MTTATVPRSVSRSRVSGLAGEVQRIAPIGLPLLGLVAWAASIPEINIRAINDLGLASVLPWTWYLAPVCFLLAFLILLTNERIDRRVAVFQIAALILVLYGTTSLIEPWPRFTVAWRHAGVAEAVGRNEFVDPLIDAYFNWPGFFIQMAFFTQAAGLQSPVQMINWVPVLSNLAYLAPVYLIMAASTRDQRLVWSGVWLFFVANWVGQDYFSPQGLNFFFYLVFVAVLLHWFKAKPGPDGGFRAAPKVAAAATFPRLIYRWIRPVEMDNARSSAILRLGLIGGLLLIFALAVISHQLTPFMMVGAVAALIVFNRVTVRSLLIIMPLLIMTWFIVGAYPFLMGHVDELAGGVGNVAGNVEENIGARISGSPDHQIVVWVRLAMTLAIGLVAGIGLFRRIRAGMWDFTIVLLAAIPFTFVALQPYGGEMLLRSYLFALAPMAFLAAAAIFPKPGNGAGVGRLAAVAVVSVVLFTGFLFARYGNERMDYMTNDEVLGVSQLYAEAPPGSLLAALSWTLPWRYQGYDLYKYMTLRENKPWIIDELSVEGLADNLDQLAPEGQRAFFVVTRSTRAEIEMFRNVSPAALDDFERRIDLDPRFTRLYSNPDARIWELNRSLMPARDTSAEAMQ